VTRGALVALLTLAPPLVAQRDTTWRFDMKNVQWSRPWYSAAFAVGCGDSSTVLGTTTAADTSRKRTACVGVAIQMREPTLTLLGARGWIHVRLDAAALSALNKSRDSTEHPRR
jgi:hypothetical protein